MSKGKSRDTHGYKGWLNSDSFLKRAFAIFGYGLIPILIFYGILLGIALLFIILGLIFSA